MQSNLKNTVVLSKQLQEIRLKYYAMFQEHTILCLYLHLYEYNISINVNLPQSFYISHCGLYI